MAHCSSCNTEVPPGARWCSICHTNLVNPSIGRLASPGRRLGAYFLDILVFFVAAILSLMVVRATVSEETGPTLLGLLLGFGLYIAYGIWALVLLSSGTTPGKNLLGMRVIKEDGQHAGFLTMLIRESIGKLISGLIFSLGFLWILFDRDNQGWHDKLMSTYVIG